MAYRDCAFVITLLNRDRLSYEAGSQLHVDHGELTAVTAAGVEHCVPVQEWRGVIINADEILTNRWRRPRPSTTTPPASPPPTIDDDPHQPD